MSQKRVVHIFGAGIAGLTVAHELAERGYKVYVYEASLQPGGKAATQYPWLKLGKVWRPMPAEHGFRLFPSFYTHVIDTMSRIPFDRNHTYWPRRSEKEAAAPRNPAEPPPIGRMRRSYTSVADNLLPSSTAAVVRKNSPPRNVPLAYGEKLGGFLRAVEDISNTFRFSDANPSDTQRFQIKCLQYLTSCAARRNDVEHDYGYGKLTWWEFLGGTRFSERFQTEIETFIRTMVAMNARDGNARTVGNVGMQLIFELFTDGSKTNRVLNGPTSEQWLHPWEEYLTQLGVHLNYGCRLTGLGYDRSSRRITRLHYEKDGEARMVDETKNAHIVLALPLDASKAVLHGSVNEGLVNDDPGLKWIRDVDLGRFTAWMAGIQFYLDQDLPICRGHVYYPESPWKLSSVSQAQFWGPDFENTYAHPEDQQQQAKVRGILSVDVCDWETNEGLFDARGLRACECETSDLAAREIWAQLRDAHMVAGRHAFPEKFLAYHLDDGIQFATADVEQDKAAPRATSNQKLRRMPVLNASRYFIHPPGSHVERPLPETEIGNLVLAGDWVRNGTDLATMEGANEAARTAVNVIIERDQLDGDLCQINELREPAEFDYAKKLDQDLYDRGAPHLFQVLGILGQLDRGIAPAGSVGAVGLAASAVRGVQIAGGGISGLVGRLY